MDSPSQGGSEALRAAAADWSLAGDRRLLALLHEIHQKIMTRCEDTNNKLEEMVTALDTASVSLQNVNNRFMALSNSQFVESRVYDDDTDVAGHAEAKMAPPAPAALPSLCEGLLTLERLHEPVAICEDSESDSESDQPTSIILKPRDPYAERPLPHIIGSNGWKNKWHVGLMPEESDSDSSTGDRRHSSVQPSESDSDSESGLERRGQPSAAFPQTYRSSASSSERDVTQPAEAAASDTARPTQADIAAELARRLGGCVAAPQPPPLDHDEYETNAPVQKIYKPQQPTSATIFSDEPPPLALSAESESDSQSDDDIFAEINRKAPYSASKKAQNATNVGIFADLRGDDFEPSKAGSEVRNSANDDLFADDEDDFKDKISNAKNRVENTTKADIFGNSERNTSKDDRIKSQNALVNEFKAKVSGKKVADKIFTPGEEKQEVKRNKPLFDEPEESDLFDNNTDKQGSDDNGRTTVKKPIGAISLFGDRKGAASIGAAILNRNRRKSSSEESNDGDSSTKSYATEQKGVGKESNRNIRDNSVPKDSKYANKNSTRDVTNLDSKSKTPSKDNSIEKSDEKDIGHENYTSKNERDIFDDLFAKTAKKENKTGNSYKAEASKKVDLFSDDIFDDIDNIFSSNIVIKKADKNVKAKSIFGDDDDLFSEVDYTVKKKEETNADIVTKVKESNNKGLFDSDEDLFTNQKSAKSKNEDVNRLEQVIQNRVENFTKTENIFDSDDEIFSDNVPKVLKSNVNVVTTVSSKPKESKQLFEDNDNDSDDLFKNIKPPVANKSSEISNKTVEDSRSDDKITNITFPRDVEIDRNSETTSQAIFVETDQRENSKMHTSTDSVTIEAHKEEDDSFKFKSIKENALKSPSIFDDDEESDDLFTKINKVTNVKVESKFDDVSATTECNAVDVKSNKIDGVEKHTDVKSPSILDSDTDEDGNTFANTRITNIPYVSNYEQTQIEKSENNTKSVFDNEIVDSEKVKKSLTSQEKLHKFVDTVDNATSNLDSNKNIDNVTTCLKSENETSKKKEPSIFDDAEPPVFEKPKEPKRSKNVNALFDDDSDDESLFFKKDDNVIDDKVDDFPVANDDRIITLFHDEPPAIDVDFGNNLEASGKKPIFDDSEKFVNTNDKHISANSIIGNSSVSMLDKSHLEQKLLDEKPAITIDNDKTDGVTISKTEPTKTIGKLKPMQFNINVNTLLPGASPKKIVKIAPQPESQIKHDQETSKTANKEVPSKMANEPTTSKAITSKLVTSASFEETPDSPVLDNKLSKDRAKIQVKRRPSTRRARIEAARKSAIDFVDGPDDTKTDSDVTSKTFEGDTDSFSINKDISVSSDNSKGDDDSETFSGEIKFEEASVNEATNIGYSNDITFATNTEADKILSADIVLSNEDGDFNEIKDLNTDVIEQYTIPDDIDEVEDLFKKKVLDLAERVTEKQAKSNEFKEKKQVLNINDTDVYIFNDPKVTDDKSATGSDTTRTDTGAENEVQYIGRVYKKTEENKELPEETTLKDVKSVAREETKITSLKKTSIFDDLSDDDDLFGGNSKAQKAKQKNVLFDPKDNEDLFAGKSSVKVKKDTASSVVGGKKSLFGDEEDDDDDLFGVKKYTIKEEPKLPSKEATTKTSTKSSAAAVFDDPLSMFGDDDDDIM